MQREINKFWQLQKAANLSNTQAASLLGVSCRQVGRWRVQGANVPKAVMMVMRSLVSNKPVKKDPELAQLELENQFNEECNQR